MIHYIFHQTLQICPSHNTFVISQLRAITGYTRPSSFQLLLMQKKSIIKQYKDCIIIILRLNAMILVLSVKM